MIFQFPLLGSTPMSIFIHCLSLFFQFPLLGSPSVASRPWCSEHSNFQFPLLGSFYQEHFAKYYDTFQFPLLGSLEPLYILF